MRSIWKKNASEKAKYMVAESRAGFQEVRNQQLERKNEERKTIQNKFDLKLYGKYFARKFCTYYIFISSHFLTRKCRK